MKSVLISIQPKWVEKIASGEKTIEVRKTRPKLETPFKCYIYETKGLYKGSGGCLFNGRGKVIGEFVCDSVYEWNYRQLQGLNGTINTYFPIFAEDLPKTCLTHKDLENYGKGKTLYGWHISDLKIYDKPKELSEFKTVCYESHCKLFYDRDCDKDACSFRTIKRPPQSYCYVERD